MSPSTLWTRRTFLSTTGLAAATLAAHPAGALDASPVLAFAPSAQGVRTTHLATGRTANLITDRRPSRLALHPTLPLLYAASAATPTLPAVLSAFSIDLTNPTHPLRPHSHQPLSLATTTPRDLAVTPDGRLVLTLDHRGQLNLHPLADGTILPLEHVRQLTGTGPDRLPQPHALLLHNQLAYIADPGTRRLALLSLASPEPQLLPAIDLPASFIPGHLTLHPAGTYLSIASLTTATLARLPLCPDTALPDPTRLSLHPRRRAHTAAPLVFPA